MKNVTKLLSIITLGATITGCSTTAAMKDQPVKSKPEPVNLTEMMPEYYLTYQAGENEGDAVIASGFGEDNELSIAIEKAIMDAHLTASSMSGKSEVKAITREYKKTTDNKGKRQQLIANNSQHKKHYEKVIETRLPKTSVNQYKIIKRDVYKMNDMYQAYVLTSHMKLDDSELNDLQVQPITQELKDV